MGQALDISNEQQTETTPVTEVHLPTDFHEWNTEENIISIIDWNSKQWRKNNGWQSRYSRGIAIYTLVTIVGIALTCFLELISGIYGEFILVLGVSISITVPLIFILQPLQKKINSGMDEDFKKRLASLFGFSYATSAGIQIDTMFSPYINHYVSDIFNGIYHGKSIKSLSYSFPAGKTAIISGLTVIEFSHDLPQMQLVNGMKMWTLDMVHYKCKELDLEGNFQHHFLLYAPEGTQIEDLQIFSPDFMQTIIERFPDIAFECDGNKLYLMQGVQDAIVGHGRISKKSITYFFEEIDFLINKFSKFETEENADVSNSDTVVDKN